MEKNQFIYKVDDSWLNIFDDKLHDIYDKAIQYLRETYKKTNDGSIRYSLKSLVNKNDTDNKMSYCFPRLEDILRPYRIMDFESVRVILLFQKPIANEYASGIPAEWDSRLRAVTQDIIPPDFYDPIPAIVSSLSQSMGSTPFKISPSSFKITSWMKQGVLPMFLTPTTESKSINETDHIIIWGDFTTNLLKNLINYHYIHKKSTPLILVSFGKVCENFTNNLVNNLDTSLKYHVQNINYDYPKTGNELIISNCLLEINRLLTSSNSQPINWLKYN